MCAFSQLTTDVASFDPTLLFGVIGRCSYLEENGSSVKAPKACSLLVLKILRIGALKE